MVICMRFSLTTDFISPIFEARCCLEKEKSAGCQRISIDLNAWFNNFWPLGPCWAPVYSRRYSIGDKDDVG